MKSLTKALANKMWSRILFCSFFALIMTHASAQYFVTGHVVTEEKEPIIGAHVVLEHSNQGTVTNEFGYFSLRASSSEEKIHSSHISYEQKVVTLHLVSDTSLTIVLPFSTLDEITVTANTQQNLDIRDRINLSNLTLPVERLQALPSFTGERDILRGLTTLPGISNGVEGMSGLFVRGGTPDQNLLLLDQAPVYNVSHLFGLFSIFNSDAIKNVELYKAGIPSRYGDRLSSVVSVNMKEGNLKEWHQRYSMGLVSSSFVVDGPIKKDTTGLMIGGRLSYLTLVGLPAKVLFEYDALDTWADYYVADLNAKINHIINSRKKVFASVYAGLDHFVGLDRVSIETRQGFDWGNVTGSIRLTNQARSNLFIQDQLTYTRFGTNLIFKSKEIRNDPGTEAIKTKANRQSLLSEWAYSKQFTYLTENNHQLRSGLEVSYRRAVPLKSHFTSSGPLGDLLPDPAKTVVNGVKGAIYLEDNVKWNEDWALTAGIRYQWYHTEKKSYHSLEPRVNIGYSISDDLVASASYSRTSQSIHGLSGNYEGLPIEGWVNASRDIPIQRSDIYSIGLGRQRQALDIRMELYYKRLYDQIDFSEGFGLLTGFHTNYADVVEIGGQGWAYGAELFIDKKMGPLKYLASYTLSWNERQFDNLSQGNKYFHRFDSRHNATLSSSLDLNEKWSFSAIFQINNGPRQTLPVASLPAPDGSVSLYYAPERNNYRLPLYHRLDIGMTHHWIKSKNGRHKSFTFNVYNAYYRKNVSHYFFKEVAIFDADNKFIGRELKLKQSSLLPIIPSFSYIIDIK